MRVVETKKFFVLIALVLTMLTKAFHIMRGTSRLSRAFAAIKGSTKEKEKEKVLVIVESPAKARTIQKFLKDMKDDHHEYVVDSCQGHIRDLAKELPEGVKQKSVCPALRVRLSDLGVDVFDNFKPFYVTLSGKEDIVKRLRSESKTADKILLATDEDREGEAISWHLIDVLKPKVPYQRAVFHEITKKAIEKSFAEPRELDMNLVHAQETRRIVDKLAGFTLSPMLWKFITIGLSAGRVQSYGLSMIANKEKERWGFVPSKYYSLEAAFHPLAAMVGGEHSFAAKLHQWHGQKIASESDFDGTSGEVRAGRNSQEILVLNKDLALDVMAKLNASDTKFAVHQKTERKITRSAPVPLITSSLQQMASKKLGFSPSKTMMLAQTLYEDGYITYMRTDSPVLSTQALDIAKEMVTSKLGASYLSTEKSSTGSSQVPKNAQEAHEAIRPAEHKGKFRTPEDLKNSTSLSAEEIKLYDLIFKTTLASVMKPALSKTITLTIAATEHVDDGAVDGKKDAKGKKSSKVKTSGDNLFRCSETIMTFDGYTAIFHPPTTSANILAQHYFDAFQIGDSLQLSTFGALKAATMTSTTADNEEEEKAVVPHEEEVLREDAHASEPSDGMNTLISHYPGIQTTPHTTRAASRYTEASFIKELEAKGVGRPSTYSHIFQVLKDRGYVLVEKQSIIPTIKGLLVAQFMHHHFPEFCDEQYTAQMEISLDRIAKGELDKLLFLQAFYFGPDSSMSTEASRKEYQGLLTKINEKLSFLKSPTGETAAENNSAETNLWNTSRCITLPYITVPGQFMLQRHGLYFQSTEPYPPEAPHPVGTTWKLPDIMLEDLRNITNDALTTYLQREMPMTGESIGVDPVTSLPIFVRHGRYGRYVQLGEDTDEGMKRRAYPLSYPVSPTDPLGDLLPLFDLPKPMGTATTGHSIYLTIGSNGLYLTNTLAAPSSATGNALRASIPAEYTLSTLTPSLALEIFQRENAHVQSSGDDTGAGESGFEGKELGVWEGNPVQIRKSRFGYYLRAGKVMTGLYQYTPEAITLPQAIALLEKKANPGASSSKYGGGRKKSGSSSSAKSEGEKVKVDDNTDVEPVKMKEEGKADEGKEEKVKKTRKSKKAEKEEVPLKSVVMRRVVKPPSI